MSNQLAGLRVAAGSKVATDARPGWFEELADCTDWDRADYRIPTHCIPDGLACNVELSGRVVRWDAPGLSGTPVVRVRVTFVGDGEPDQVVGGWVLYNSLVTLPQSCTDFDGTTLWRD